MSTSTKHVTAYYLDAKDGRPATGAPLRHGPALPSPALVVDAVDRRQTPALIIGRMPADEPLAAGMELVSEERHAELLTSYNDWRDELAAAAQLDTLAALADYRFEVETGGIEIDGQRILTDRESQAQLTGAYQALTQPFVDSIDWKSADGWVTVSEAELRPIAEAVARHVQGSFTAERRVAESLAGGDDYRTAFDEALEAVKASQEEAATAAD
ncbi:protein of unknown function [Chromohalobacter canadensis]|uniref:DUF4376 domain-containing protein n=1 Tax=Chromohalobacter canadensis TaxID=141389 RepID=A0A285VUZ7_9GAMM|nr:DUF4376 domain-containing protein [Chromohalobacter canadensis]SOC56461.1 protein of unknown function [Chromohalobacter canadensis]